MKEIDFFKPLGGENEAGEPPQTDVEIHFVIPETDDELFDAHTHGLNDFNHKEFQVLVPGFCRLAAVALLRDHADAVINNGEEHEAGELFEIDGAICTYVEVAGDAPGEPTRLRIVDVPGACKCELCHAASMEHTDTGNKEN